tara:strand:+ start:3367 stop:3990 length:624 start_codon:yes stop_codon:yes gene_type:complete
MQTAIDINVSKLIQKAINTAMTYEEYSDLMRSLVSEKKSTGIEQSEDLANYTLLNNKRMKRLGKTTKIDTNIIEKIKQVDTKITWLVLTESWCGDAAQSMPIMQKIAEQNPNIDVKVILRDENLDIMHHFLYNNTLSIPRLIAINTNTHEVTGDWGPRPNTLTNIVEAFKTKHGSLSAEFKEKIQVWYTKDKGVNTISELVQLLPLK